MEFFKSLAHILSRLPVFRKDRPNPETDCSIVAKTNPEEILEAAFQSETLQLLKRGEADVELASAFGFEIDYGVIAVDFDDSAEPEDLVPDTVAFV